MDDYRTAAPPASTADRTEYRRRPPIRVRLSARLRPGPLDMLLAVGAPTAPGSALAVRAARLTSDAERSATAGMLRRHLRDAAGRSVFASTRIPLHRRNIAEAKPTIEAIIRRLESAANIDARGMARLHRVLADGLGPMYAYGDGDLVGRLRAALAAM